MFNIVLDAYKKDNEAFPQFIEIRDELIKNNAFSSDENVPGAVFIDAYDTIEDSETAVSDYANYGPNNEVYLMNRQGIAFALNVTNPDNIASIQIGAKSPNGGGSFKVNDGESIALDTATEMYYDITKYVKNTDGSFAGDIAVIASGDEGAIVSLTNLKITFIEDPASDASEPDAPLNMVFAPSRAFLTTAANTMLMAMNPVQPEEPATEPATEPETEPATEPVTEPETDPKDAKKEAKAAEKAAKETAKAIEKAAKTVSNLLGNVLNALKGNTKKNK